MESENKQNEINNTSNNPQSINYQTKPPTLNIPFDDSETYENSSKNNTFDGFLNKKTIYKLKDGE